MRGEYTSEYTPHYMHEYQSKGLTKFAFCKRLIPKNMSSATNDVAREVPEKEKAAALRLRSG